MGAGLGILLLSYIAVYLIDVRNIYGLRDLFQSRTVPVFWDFMFTEAGPIELLQWLFLAGLSTVSYYLYKVLDEQDRKEESVFWGLFSVAGFLMFLEDSLDIRHLVLRNLLTFEWVVLNLLETLYFVMLGLIPLVAVLKYGKYIRQSRVTVVILAVGFVFYGSAAFISGPGDLTSVNYVIGDYLYEATGSMGDGELRELYELGDQNILDKEEELGIEMMDVRYRLKDYLVEESLELVGATMLLASALSYLKFVQTKPRDLSNR